VTHYLEYSGGDAYAPITSVRQHEGWLYLGSQTQRGIARIRKPRGVSSSSPGDGDGTPERE
jgi:hypothetical protein